MRNYIKRFTVKPTDCDLWYWVFVYDDKEKLRVDAKKYKSQDDFNDCLAVCQPQRRIDISSNGEKKEYNNCGAIRILDTAGSEITSHELLHASLNLYREKNNTNADFGEQCNDAEEELCYIFGQMFSMLVYKMYKQGVWKESETAQTKGGKKMKITINISKEDLRELEDLIDAYKQGVWSDESYPLHFAYLLIKYLVDA